MAYHCPSKNNAINWVRLGSLRTNRKYFPQQTCFIPPSVALYQTSAGVFSFGGCEGKKGTVIARFAHHFQFCGFSQSLMQFGSLKTRALERPKKTGSWKITGSIGEYIGISNDLDSKESLKGIITNPTNPNHHIKIGQTNIRLSGFYCRFFLELYIRVTCWVVGMMHKC